MKDNQVTQPCFKEWMEKNWELIDPYSHQFIKENSLVRTLKKIQE